MPLVSGKKASTVTLTARELKAAKAIRSAWTAGVVTTAVFDRRWNAMPPETQKPFLDSAGNREWMIGTDGSGGAHGALWDRRFHQMADTALWMEVLIKEKSIAKPDARWMEIMMMGGYSVDSGDVASRDGCANILENMKSWGVKAQVVEETAALVGCTSRSGVLAELFITKPAQAVKETRAIVAAAAKDAKVKAPALKFLDDPMQRRAFAEALACVKLADASRGQYGETVSALLSSSFGRDPKLMEWRKAVAAEHSASMPKVDAFQKSGGKTAAITSMKAALEAIAAPFSNPTAARSTRLDTAALAAGPLRDALSGSAARLPRASGDGGSLHGVFALYASAAQKDAGKAPLGYAVMAYGGDPRGAWSAIEYFDPKGAKLGAASGTA